MSPVKQTVCGSGCIRRERNKEIPRANEFRLSRFSISAQMYILMCMHKQEKHSSSNINMLVLNIPSISICVCVCLCIWGEGEVTDGQ